jgi:hypothetical protein
MDTASTPIVGTKDKKRKFDEFFSPENRKSFVEVLQTALKDPAITVS